MGARLGAGGWRRLVLSTVAATGLLAGTLALSDAVSSSQAPDGGPAITLSNTTRPAPPLSGVTLTGTQADLAQQRGRVVVVTIWASWCAPCHQELPVLATAERRYAASGVAFLGVLTRDSATAANALLAETGATHLPSILDPDGSIAVTWGATGVPETYIVDQAGVIRGRLVGPVTATWLDEELKPLLAG